MDLEKFSLSENFLVTSKEDKLLRLHAKNVFFFWRVLAICSSQEGLQEWQSPIFCFAKHKQKMCTSTLLNFLENHTLIYHFLGLFGSSRKNHRI